MLLSAALMLALLAAPEAGPWDRLTAMVGEWQGIGTGAPGEAAGGFTISYDLQKRVLVRRNRADYPATPQRPAFSHEDLTIIYREESSGAVRAAYYDNEGHVIHYTVTASSGRLVFLGDAVGGQPRFRLTYALKTANEVGLDFEIAPPNAQDSFKPYIQATARRR